MLYYNEIRKLSTLNTWKEKIMEFVDEIKEFLDVQKKETGEATTKT